MTTLIVWDFDWSAIEENSDTFVIKEIGAWDIYERLRLQGMGWTALMDATLRAAHKELGVSEADVHAALSRTPLHPSVAEAIRGLAQSGKAEAIIISDANSVYINAILRQHSLQDCFSTVFTNPAEFVGGALHVRPHDAEPAGCRRLCPVNLCKGQVLMRFLDQKQQQGRTYSSVVYVGDGRGDYCPTVKLLQLPLPSLILARGTYPDGVPCALWVKLRADLEGRQTQHEQQGQGQEGQEEQQGAEAQGEQQQQSVRQRVLEWHSPEELAGHLRGLLAQGQLS